MRQEDLIHEEIIDLFFCGKEPSEIAEILNVHFGYHVTQELVVSVLQSMALIQK